MRLTTQYYRPPFPNDRYWREDLRQIRKLGFSAITVAMPWAWVEPGPGCFEFADFDRLFDEASDAGLEVVINTWAEIQPVWIEREVPGCGMVDHMGRPVVSSTLAYMHFGVIPGGCTDHPEVRTRAAAFYDAVARHFGNRAALHSWDCWNEMRWLSQTDGYVCFCEHTLTRYRAWLERDYGSLDALNKAWQRRYRDWRDVMPARLPTRTYLDAMAWQRFIAARTEEDLSWRYDAIRAIDTRRPIVAHAAFPSTWGTGENFEWEMALMRGNDWALARRVDGYGCSHFPAWFGFAPSQVGAIMESGRCAAGGNPYLLAELQGGASAHGLRAQQPVDGAMQARWLWNGVARGAKGANFWCWRDEVFGRESSGFGIAGTDGQASSRLEHLAAAARLFAEHEALLDGYAPAAAEIGVVFEPEAYRLDWASRPIANPVSTPAEPPFPAGKSVQGYLRALERLQFSYDVIEPRFSETLEQYKFIILPWPLVADPQFMGKLKAWCERGGTLLIEAGIGSFDRHGLFTYPSDRESLTGFGFTTCGRRLLPKGRPAFRLGAATGELRAGRWWEPLARGIDASICADPQWSPAFGRSLLGAGRVFYAGSFFGQAYELEPYPDFERFVKAVADEAGIVPPLRCSLTDGDKLAWRLGQSTGNWLLFVISEHKSDTKWTIEDCRLKGFRQAFDLVTNAEIPICSGQLSFTTSNDGYQVLHFR